MPPPERAPVPGPDRPSPFVPAFYSMMRVLSCDAPYGQGGVGQHFAQMVETTRRAEDLQTYYSPGPRPDDREGHTVTVNTYGLLRYTPLRFSPAWKTYILHELFDWHVARQLSAPAKCFMGFVGKSLRSFRRAAALGFERLELVVANSHVENVARLHERAHANHGLRDSWLNGAQIRKTLREYERADVIYVHSEYTRRTFIEAGIAPSRLRRTHLRVDPRFVPPPQRPDDAPFRLVYVGRVDATKGIPLLLEAFHRLSIDPLELTIVGNWSTRRMRRYVEDWVRRDARITIDPGDPLPALQQADLFVHPTYEDGFGYAPMEALACGVPVIVTEDTGMKEHVEPGRNGYVVPTGDRGALVRHIEKVYAAPLATTESLLPARAADASP